MRGPVLGAMGVVVLAGVLGAWLVWGGGERPERPDSLQAPRATGPQRGGPRSTPVVLPRAGSLSIRGWVRDEQGPVAGVRVSATQPVPGETLSELPCPPMLPDLWRTRRFAECLGLKREETLERVGAREGEALVYTETTTGADGTFVLEGLPEGRFALWALGARGARLRPDVAAGTEGVEVVLGEPYLGEGWVRDEEGQVLSGVRVTALHAGHTRFFDALTGEDGRFRIGPVPAGDYAFVFEKEGWVPRLLTAGELAWQGAEVVLVQPRRLEGQVLSDGEPVPGVEVEVRPPSDQGFTPRETTADEQGRFAFEGLGRGRHLLTASRDGRHAFKEVELDGVQGLSRVVLSLRTMLHAEGTVRDETGQPVVGAEVSVRFARGPGFEVVEDVTDERGHYRLETLEARPYTFKVTAPGHMDVERATREVKRDMGPLDFTLKRAVSVTGTVVDEEGRPMGGLSLMLMGGDEGPEELTGLMDMDHTEEDGRFVLDAPVAGPWTLEVRGDDFLSETVPVQAPAEGVRVVLRRGGQVEGVVTDAKGLPVDGAQVALWEEGKEGPRVRNTETDEQGHFLLRGLEAGRYEVDAVLDRGGVVRSASRPIELRGFERVEVTLRFEAGRTLSGVVVDHEGQPVEGALVRVDRPSEDIDVPARRRGMRSLLPGEVSPTDARTGPDGRFTVRHLLAEAYVVTAGKEGYRFDRSRSVGGVLTEDEELRIGGDTAQVRLVLERYGRITGRLIGPNGVPLRTFQVNDRPFSGASGAFSWIFEDTGTEELEFAAAGMAPLHRRVKVRAGVDVDLGEVRMGPGRRVLGRVLDAETGAPVEGVQIMLVDVPGDTPGEPVAANDLAETGEEGTFELPHVEARPMVLLASHGDYLAWRTPLGAGEESVTVRLEAGSAVELTVRDHRGELMSGYVLLTSEDGFDRRLIAVQGGRKVQRGISAGPYLAQIRRTSQHDTGEGLFVPQRVQVPASGRVALDFRQRREGAELILRTQEATEVGLALLYLGEAPPPTTLEHLQRWRSLGVPLETDEGMLSHRYLPPGRATLLLVKGSGPGVEELLFHAEPLELPEGGVLERELRPRWQRLLAK